MGKYLAEAKNAVRGSKSKELLLEAVENLANALEEIQNLENLDLETKKGELSFYRQYCDHAAELMIDSEELTPYAAKVLRKGLPILDRNIKELLEEIRKRTELIRGQTKGTQFEELGDKLSQSSQSLLEVRDPIGFRKEVNYMQDILKDICSKLPEGQKGEAREFLEMMNKEQSIEDKIPLLAKILSIFPPQLDIMAKLNRLEEGMGRIYDNTENTIEKTTIIIDNQKRMDQKLDNISFGIFKFKLNSHNVISNLDAMKKELEKLKETEVQNALSINNLNSTQAEKLNDLKNDLIERLDEIKVLSNKLPNEVDTEITNLRRELKQSDLNKFIQRLSEIASIIGLIVSFM